MFDATSPFEGGQRRRSPITLATIGALPALQRSLGRIQLSVNRGEAGTTSIGRLSQSGSARLLFPKLAGGACEAVVINTSGGLAGGDRFEVEAQAGEGTKLTLTTQAAEKIYRTPDVAAQMMTRLGLARQAQLHWIPQMAILFDQARLVRRLDVEMHDSASLLIAESVVFGRTARGEAVRDGHFADRWRIRRGDRLIFADQTLFSGDIAAQLNKVTVTGGGAAICSLLYVAPDAEARLEGMRAAVRDVAGPEGGISAWNGMLAMRLVGADGYILWRRVTALLKLLRGAGAPSVWQS